MCRALCRKGGGLLRSDKCQTLTWGFRRKGKKGEVSEGVPKSILTGKQEKGDLLDHGHYPLNPWVEVPAVWSCDNLLVDPKQWDQVKGGLP